MERRKFINTCLSGVALTALGLPEVKEVFAGSSKKLWKWSTESYYYNKLKGGLVECQLCPNECVLDEGERSFCRTRTNYKGKLYALTYGNPCAVHVDPIEKKPLMHFLPGTTALSIATAGCNFRCLNCQNWEISQKPPEETNTIELFPKEVVWRAEVVASKSIAYTYSGPIAFYEYMLDTTKIARSKGIKNVWKDQGYINTEPLEQLCKYMDASSVDLKHFSEKLYRKINRGSLKVVLNSLKTLKKHNVWIEIVHLIIPTINDDMDMIKDMCEWIHDNLGADTPLHLSRFYPMYKLTHLPPTPVRTIEKARKVAMEEGLNYVYIGNVPAHRSQHTVCPKCEKVVIKRAGYSILEYNLDGNTCKYCGKEIAGVWE